MAWIVRFCLRVSGILMVMVLVEFLAFVLYREFGLTRVLAIPVNFALVGVAGYDTVKRLPLVWGALVGSVVAAATNLVSWPIGAYVLEGSFRYPDEADPLIVGTSLLLAAVIGAIVGVLAGVLARNRRRKRSRRSALGKLAYSPTAELDALTDEVASPAALPMADRQERPR